MTRCRKKGSAKTGTADGSGAQGSGRQVAQFLPADLRYANHGSGNGYCWLKANTSRRRLRQWGVVRLAMQALQSKAMGLFLDGKIVSGH